MLTDLKQLNDLNSIMSEFLAQNKFQPMSVFNSNNTNSFNNNNNNINTTGNNSSNNNQNYDYDDYISNLGLDTSANNDVELDSFLKEKQEKIENLQKEKSSLIRKLLEAKSKSENINKNILKLKREQPMSPESDVSQSAKSDLLKLNSTNTTTSTRNGEHGEQQFSRFNELINHKQHQTCPNFIEFSKMLRSNDSKSNENLNKTLTTSKIKKLF
jgi:hypothetical protein